MRKLITTVTTAALIAFAGGTAAYAVLDQSHFAVPAASVHNLSTHVSHDGHSRRPGHTPLFTF
jgi:hypothetical protein